MISGFALHTPAIPSGAQTPGYPWAARASADSCPPTATFDSQHCAAVSVYPPSLPQVARDSRAAGVASHPSPTLTPEHPDHQLALPSYPSPVAQIAGYPWAARPPAYTRTSVPPGAAFVSSGRNCRHRVVSEI